MVIFTDALPLHPPASVTVTEYGPVVFTLVKLFTLPFDQLKVIVPQPEEGDVNVIWLPEQYEAAPPKDTVLAKLSTVTVSGPNAIEQWLTSVTVKV